MAEVPPPPPPRRQSSRLAGTTGVNNFNEDSDGELEAMIRGHDPKAALESDASTNNQSDDSSSDQEHQVDHDNSSDDDSAAAANRAAANRAAANRTAANRAAAAANDGEESSASSSSASSSSASSSSDSSDDEEPQPFPDEKRQEYLRNFDEVLSHYHLMFIKHCTVGQLATKAVDFIQSAEAIALRDPEVQQLINEHHAQGQQSFHKQELNELCCIMDYLIKQKCIIHSIIRRLEAGDPRIRVFARETNPDFGRRVMDVYVFIPAELRYQICQGQAFRLFGEFSMSSA